MLQSLVQSLCICGCIYNPVVDVPIALVWCVIHADVNSLMIT